MIQWDVCLKFNPTTSILTPKLSLLYPCARILVLVYQSAPTVLSLINFNVLNFFQYSKILLSMPPLMYNIFFLLLIPSGQELCLLRKVFLMMIVSLLVGILKANLYINSLSPTFTYLFIYTC